MQCRRYSNLLYVVTTANRVELGLTRCFKILLHGTHGQLIKLTRNTNDASRA